jgi:hypothetical protein
VKRKQNSAVLAGSIAAVIAFVLWSRLLKTSHVISFDTALTDSDVVNVPISLSGGFSGLGL